MNVINQVIGQFCFKSRPNNTSVNPNNFDSGEFRRINLTLEDINTF